MRTHLLSFSLLFIILVSMNFSNDYSFTITGDLPVNKLKSPSNLFENKSEFIFQPEKRAIMLTVLPAKAALSVPPPAKQSDIFFLPSKSMSLITIFQLPPEKLQEESMFFDPDQWMLVHKPLKFTLNEQKTGGIAVNLIHRKALQIPEIAYHSKARTYQVPSPPKTEMVFLSEERFYLKENGVGFDPLKGIKMDQSRFSLGTSDLEEYWVGFANPFVETMISNQKGSLFFKNDSVYIGAQASIDGMTGIAYLPNFDFKLDLFDHLFVLRSVTAFQFLPSFDFGLALFNTTPLPVINWYTTGSNTLFSMGMDVFERSAYGLGIRLKNDPYRIGAATGYNFNNGAFHAMINGKYTFNRGQLNASVSYNDGISMDLGAAYQLIQNQPFSMTIYGNIDYQKDWLFSAGTKMRLGDIDLNVKIKFITGGLSVDVEAGYAL